MSIEFNRASAARVESTRADTLAGQQQGVDVAVFTSWLDAYNSDLRSGLIESAVGTGYTPTPGTLSGFLYERVRPEFRPAFVAWIDAYASDPRTAPPSPFFMEEYVLASADLADDLLTKAEEHVASALQANQNSDNYVLTAVGFALVIFFAGLSTKLVARKNQLIALSIAGVLALGGLTVLILQPKISPF